MLSFSEFNDQPLLESNGLTILGEVEKLSRRFLTVRPDEHGGAVRLKAVRFEFDQSFEYDPNLKDDPILDGEEMPEHVYTASCLFSPIFCMVVITNTHTNRIAEIILNIVNPAKFDETSEAGNVVEFLSQTRRVIKKFLEISYYQPSESEAEFLNRDCLCVKWLYRKEENKLGLDRIVRRWMQMKLVKHIIREPMFRRMDEIYKKTIERIGISLTESVAVESEESLEESYKPSKDMIAGFEKAFSELSKKLPASQAGLKLKLWKYRNPQLGTGFTLGYTDSPTDKDGWSYCDNVVCELETSEKPKCVNVRFFKEMKDVKDSKGFSAKSQKAFTNVLGDIDEFVDGYSLKDRGSMSDVIVDLAHFGE